ncbi:MAG TPA: phosphodiester glycosidase family protein [Candidatus Limnocylindria bacterium]|nr:phosphodiester glycosidase family protein [Candidatus Limnocylindria bacterium]
MNYHYCVASRVGRFVKLCVATLSLGIATAVVAQDITGVLPPLSAGVGYTNYHIAKYPWSIHVVSVDLKDPTLSLHSFHSRGAAIGMATLSDQVRRVSPAIGKPVVAVNGDFYKREQVYAGDPRGIQIVEGEILSGPNDRATMWTDTNGLPHMAVVSSRFAVTWPIGASQPMDLNGERDAGGIELYSSAIGASTHTQGGREIVLERTTNSAWLPLQIGKSYIGKVREVINDGDNPVPAGTLVLSLGPDVTVPAGLKPGSLVKLSLATTPDLTGARVAISGGPTLLHGGKRQKVVVKGEGFESTSMLERHPRTAIGWNNDTFYFVEIDGRQRGLSVVMTLDEVAGLLLKLGCEEGMNLDGGGSATMWAEGEIRNSPCDGHERLIANSLMMVRAPKKPSQAADAKTGAPTASAKGN